MSSGEVDVDALIAGRYGLDEVGKTLLEANFDPLEIKRDYRTFR